MGLNFRGADIPYEATASWAYSGFMNFRERLAQRIGIHNRREWWRKGSPRTSDDPIYWLLDHSDCDGELTPQQCVVIAPRLRELLSGSPTTFFDEYDRKMGLRLANHMEACAKAEVPLEFC